jgi:hypothetical protein
MFKFIAICTIVILGDRWFLGTVVRAAPQLWEGSMRDVEKRYGLVKFPRTALAVLACVAAGLESLTSVGQSTQYLITIGFMLAFLVAAAVDTWKAQKSGKVE